MNSEIMAVFISPAYGYRPVNMMWEDLSAALRQKGVHAQSYTAREGPDMLSDMRFVLKDLIDWPGLKVLVSCNGGMLPQIPDENGHPVLFAERFGIATWTLMIDEPAGHFERLSAAPADSIVSYIDAQHRSFIADRALGRRGAFFMPHGGPPVTAAPIKSGERPATQIFLGDVHAERPYEQWLEESAPDLAGRGVLDKVAQRCLDPENMTYSYDHLVQVCREEGETLDRARIPDLVKRLEAYVHATTRYRVLASIKSHRVTIYGTVAEGAVKGLAHHDLQGPTAWSRGLAAMAQARFVISPVSVFRSGGHPRVTYGLSRGCLPFCTPTTLYTEREDPVAFALKGDGQDDDRLAAAHASADLDAVQDAFMARYAGSHTWGQCAETFCRAAADMLA